jgi:hypothetical protein
VALYYLILQADQNRNDELRIGSLRFWGPAAFIDHCKRATCRLRDFDETIYRYFVSGKLTTFWLHPTGVKRRIWNVPYRYFSISERFYSWLEEGIIGFMVYVYFIDQSRLRKASASQLRSLASKHTTDWMRLHLFPNTLIESFTN